MMVESFYHSNSSEAFMDDKKIFITVEPNYITPFWFSQTIQGLNDFASKHKTAVSQINRIDKITPASTAIVIIGTNRNWIQEQINQARSLGLRIILIGAVPNKYGEDISGTMYGGRSVMYEMVRYFKSHERHRLALLEINTNSSNDITKYETFLNAASNLDVDSTDEDVYFKGFDSKKPSELFLSRIREYDGVICSNDYVGAFVLSYANEHGIKVPQQLFVAGLGDIMLCRYTSPSLTSATRSYYETGEQAYSIWSTINQNPDVVSIVTTMKSVIRPRGSTAFLPVLVEEPVGKQPPVRTQSEEIKPIVTKRINDVRSIQDCLSQCDSTDMKIIDGVINGDSIEKIAESINNALGTVNYRLKKLYKNAGVKNKNDFYTLFKQYISLEMLNKDAFDEFRD